MADDYRAAGTDRPVTARSPEGHVCSMWMNIIPWRVRRDWCSDTRLQSQSNETAQARPLFFKEQRRRRSQRWLYMRRAYAGEVFRFGVLAARNKLFCACQRRMNSLSGGWDGLRSNPVLLSAKLVAYLLSKMLRRRPQILLLAGSSLTAAAPLNAIACEFAIQPPVPFLTPDVGTSPLALRILTGFRRLLLGDLRKTDPVRVGVFCT